MESTTVSAEQLSDAQKVEGPLLVYQTEAVNTPRPDRPDSNVTDGRSAEQRLPLCRFHSQGKHCHYGRRCRFLHQRAVPPEGPKKLENMPERTQEHGRGEAVRSGGPQGGGPKRESGACSGKGAEEPLKPSGPQSGKAKQERARRPCRYFLSGFCAMEDGCRFWHPQQLPPVKEDLPGDRERSSTRPPGPVVPRPPATPREEVKLADLTDELSKQLRATEVSQLMKRFPSDRLIVQEREDGQLTYYRVAVTPTDPDWPFDLKELDIMISFPDKYPQEVFTIDVPEDQTLPSVMCRHVQQASEEWLQAKHATNQLLGRVEILFLPYLRWLDRSMERLFTEGARQLKQDRDLEKAGIQFVPYQHLQASVLKESADPTEEHPEDGGCLPFGSEGEEGQWVEEDEGEKKEERAEPGGDGEEASHAVENVKSGEPRRGTEVKLQGLRLGEGTATVVATQVTVSLQCNRCKVTSDLTLSGRLTCVAQCEKCGARISAAFRPSMLHHYSAVLGYLDLTGAVPVDLVLQECRLVIGCLSCSQEDTLQSLSYGQNKEMNCQHCHSKVSMFVDATSFQYIQPRSRNSAGQTGSELHHRRQIRDPAVQSGKPLPEKGTCKHFKQSHRWLRFPCCGRAYPCDVCHDEDQDHLMELATRMLCGYCAKEQPFSNGKACVSCGSMMTRGTHTSHWEGGLGCRNKIKMNRNDRQKYANISKTVSRKAQSESK